MATHETEAEARAAEIRLSLQYRIPTLPFVARQGGGNGLVGDQALIDEVFAAVDSFGGGLRLLHDHGLSIHHRMSRRARSRAAAGR